MKTALITRCTSSNKSFISVCSQNIWPDFVSDDVIHLLVTAHDSLSKKTLKTILTWLQAVKRFIQDRQEDQLFPIPSVTLKLYLSYGFAFKRLLKCLVLEAKSLVDGLNHKTVREEVPKYDNPWTLLSLLYYTTSLTEVSEEWKDFCLGEVLECNGVVWGHLLENRFQWDSATNFPIQYC